MKGKNQIFMKSISHNLKNNCIFMLLKTKKVNNYLTNFMKQILYFWFIKKMYKGTVINKCYFCV